MMTHRTLIFICASAILALALPLAASEPPDGLAPTEWAAIQDQIEAEVDRDLIAGKSDFVRGEFGSEHGLVRTAVLGGDYSELPQQDNSDGPRFGHSVAIDGDWLAVGAPGTIWTHPTHSTAAHGAVFVFRREVSGWTLRQRLLRTNTPAGGRCGHAVALRLPYLAAGCPEVDNASGTQILGWMRVWHLNADSGMFQIQSSHAGSSNGRCGTALAISANYIAMGCPTSDADEVGGRVMIYRRNPDTAIFEIESLITAPNAMASARFGHAVALTQTLGQPVRLAVGAPLRSPSPFIASGAVHVFERSSPGGTPTWTQSQFITAPTQTTGAFFGQALAMHPLQMVIGAPSDFCGVSGPDRCGRTYRYARSDGAWQYQGTDWALNAPGGAPNGPQSGMYYGANVALGWDGINAAAAPRTNGQNLLFGNAEDQVGLVEFRRYGSGPAYHGVVRPDPLSQTTLAEGQFGTGLDFSVGARRLAVGYPGVGSSLPPGSGGARRGQVWIYDTDEIFVDGFEHTTRSSNGDAP